MRPRSTSIILALALAVSSVGAQDVPAPKLNLSGTYEISGASVGEEWVTLDFKATISNLAAEDATGIVVLRRPNDIQRVFERFGEQTVSAGGNTTVSGNVRVPRDEYDSWQKDASPALFLYMQNDRGEIKTFRIPLSRVGPKKD